MDGCHWRRDDWGVLSQSELTEGRTLMRHEHRRESKIDQLRSKSVRDKQRREPILDQQVEGINLRSAEGINKGIIEQMCVSVPASLSFYLKAPLKLWFDSVWLGVTGGVMVGVTFRGGGGGGGVKILVRDQQRTVSIRGEIGRNLIIHEYRRELIRYQQR